jgi:phytoene desaturase
MSKTAIVVGSGIAGLAASVRLACQGFAVTVIEKEAYPGGKLSVFNLGEYRFDRGPSLFTMPSLVDELFVLAGKNPGDYFRYRKMDESCRYFFESGKRLTAYSSHDKMRQELDKSFPGDSANFFKLLNHSEFLYRNLSPVFLEVSLHRPSQLLKKHTLKALANSWRMGLFGKLHTHHRNLFRHAELVQYFDRFATYNGSDPYRAPATLDIIPHLEHGIGTFIPENGMGDISRSIYHLASELGVKFIFSNKVKEITHHSGEVSGVILEDGRALKASVVVSNMDIWFTYRDLLKNKNAPEKILRQEKSSSALVFYWAVSNSFPQLGLHNILFSADYRAEFAHISEGHGAFHDPTVYINITSKVVQADAPTGGENWFVMVNTSNHNNQDWDTIVKLTRAAVVKKVNRMLGTNMEAFIKAEEVWTPAGIEALTGSYRGALYGNASNGRYAAFLRHANFSKKIKGLYFCSGSVHPGGGIPLCLRSAEIAAKCISEDIK